MQTENHAQDDQSSPVDNTGDVFELGDVSIETKGAYGHQYDGWFGFRLP